MKTIKAWIFNIKAKAIDEIALEFLYTKYSKYNSDAGIRT
jgi:hypothetical protein